MEFIWKGKNTNIKRSGLCSKCENGGYNYYNNNHLDII